MSDAIPRVQELAEYLTAPVVNTYLHNDSFPTDHALSAGPIGYCGSKAAMRTIAKADVVLALGTRLGPFGTLPQYDIDYWPKNAAVIQVDIDLRQLGLNKPAHLAIAADAGEFVAQLLIKLRRNEEPRRPNADRLAELKKEKATWDQELRSWSTAPCVKKSA